MKFVSSVFLLLLMSPACLANPPVYTTSEGKPTPIPDGILDSTTHCGLNLEACSKNKETDFCRDIIGFSGTRTMMNFLAESNKLSKKYGRDVGKTNKEEIDSYAKKKKDYTQRFVAVGLTKAQINNIPFPPDQYSASGFYDSQEFRCKPVSEPSTPLYTANDGSSSPIPAGVLDSKTKCGLNLKICAVEGVSLWKTHDPFCRDVKKLAGLKHEIEEKGRVNDQHITSEITSYIDALEAIGLTPEQIHNIPPYAFEDQQKDNMDQHFFCQTNSTPNNTLNKPAKKTLKEKVANFFRRNKEQK